MGHTVALLRGGLGCADVQAPIDLAGVGGDDLAVGFLRQLQRQARLPHRRRPNDDDEGRLLHFIKQESDLQGQLSLFPV